MAAVGASLDSSAPERPAIETPGGGWAGHVTTAKMRRILFTVSAMNSAPSSSQMVAADYLPRAAGISQSHLGARTDPERRVAVSRWGSGWSGRRPPRGPSRRCARATPCQRRRQTPRARTRTHDPQLLRLVRRLMQLRRMLHREKPSRSPCTIINSIGAILAAASVYGPNR